MIGDNTYLIPLLVLNLTMRHNIVSLKLKYNHGTTEYRGIFSRYLLWSKISGTAKHYCQQCPGMLRPNCNDSCMPCRVKNWWRYYN